MILLMRVAAILLRIILYFSPIAQKLSKILIFDILPYSISNLKESSFLLNMKNRNIDDKSFSNSHMYFSPILTQKLFYFVDYNEFITIIIFALMDVTIGIQISKIFKINNNDSKVEEENSNTKSFYIELIYLFNPVSILNCLRLRLDIFFTFILFTFVLNKNTFAGPIFLLISLVTTPGNIFTILSLLIYFYLNNEIKKKSNFIMVLIGSYFLIVLSCYNREITNLNSFYNVVIGRMLSELSLIYRNYYTIRDTLPNIGLFWALIPNTFLKYQKFSVLMLLNYQIIMNISIICMMKRLNYNKNNSLILALLLMGNHIIDRYPCDNHYIVCILLIVQHYDIFEHKIINLAIYGTFAGYTLIAFRGYPYKAQRTGSSNYLYFQNLTYLAFQIFVFLCVVFSIHSRIKRMKHQSKMKTIVDDIVSRVLEIKK